MGVSNNFIYLDDSFGEKGFSIWLIPLGFVFFLGIIFFTLKVLINGEFLGVEDLFVSVMGNVFLLGILFKFSIEAYYGFKSIQELTFKNNKIYIVNFFRVKKFLKHSSLIKVDISRPSSFQKKFCILKPRANLVILTFCSGDKYYISSDIFLYNELKAKLTEIVERNKSQSSS